MDPQVQPFQGVTNLPDFPLVPGRDDHFQSFSRRFLKNDHLLRFPHPSSLRRTIKYASLLRISGALHLALFEQPEKDNFFGILFC
jgi:hypothetical protein